MMGTFRYDINHTWAVVMTMQSQRLPADCCSSAVGAHQHIARSMVPLSSGGRVNTADGLVSSTSQLPALRFSSCC